VDFDWVKLLPQRPSPLQETDLSRNILGLPTVAAIRKMEQTSLHSCLSYDRLSRKSQCSTSFPSRYRRAFGIFDGSI
jgi:hypothetical protein